MALVDPGLRKKARDTLREHRNVRFLRIQGHKIVRSSLEKEFQSEFIGIEQSGIWFAFCFVCIF